MNRGEVYLTNILLPDRVSQSGRQPVRKYIVLLQGGQSFASQTEVAVVIASTLRPPGRRPQRYEVIVGQPEGFQRETVIDCRWPYTLIEQEVTAGRLHTTLPRDVMERVNVALVAGLQMNVI